MTRIVDSIVKRDGRMQPFDPIKIVSAVKRCFMNGCHSPEKFAETMGREITQAVINVLERDDREITVELVQRLVIQQLWSLGLFEAGEHYTLYRDARAAQREEIHVPLEVQQRILEDQKHFPTDLEYYQFMSKFSRWRWEDSRRETWREACNRSMNWFKSLPQTHGVVSAEEWQMLDDSLFNREATCALRVLQMAGPALDRCHIGVFNCAALPLSDWGCFAELLYVLMQGSGCGFSVENEFVGKLPKIKKQRGKHKKKFLIPDNTEGWCDALKLGLETWSDGGDIEFDDSELRPANAILRTKGGRSSGPEPLRYLLSFARSVLLKRQGQYLTDLDCHDIACVGGKIVQVGGVRRASTISISDLDSEEMRNAKMGNWYDKYPWRTMANNSAAYDEIPTDIEFMKEWLSLAESHSGERGIFNRVAINKHLPKRRKRIKWWLCNPCGEISFRPYGLCNLSISIARPKDTRESLARKVRIATLFGVIQSTCTKFNYVRDEWRKNAEEERLLGVDITGHADCPLLRYGASGRAELLDYLKAEVQTTRAQLAKRFNIPDSAADTCVKPSGDSAVLFDCGSGISARYAAYQIRWIRERIDSPIAKFLINSGVPYAEAPEDKKLLVFGFPRKAPEGCTLRDDMNSIQQLENWLEWKTHWAEHSVSATVYIKPDEWIKTGAWVKEHFEEITSIAFNDYDNGNYRYSPNEEITKEQYEEMVANFPVLNWSKLPRFEDQGGVGVDASHAIACSANGSCDF